MWVARARVSSTLSLLPSRRVAVLLDPRPVCAPLRSRRGDVRRSFLSRDSTPLRSGCCSFLLKGHAYSLLSRALKSGVLPCTIEFDFPAETFAAQRDVCEHRAHAKGRSENSSAASTQGNDDDEWRPTRAREATQARELQLVSRESAASLANERGRGSSSKSQVELRPPAWCRRHSPARARAPPPSRRLFAPSPASIPPFQALSQCLQLRQEPYYNQTTTLSTHIKQMTSNGTTGLESSLSASLLLSSPWPALRVCHSVRRMSG